MTMPRLAARACPPEPQYHPGMGALAPVPRICGRAAGIGKSRLLAQALADARGRGMQGRGPGRGTGADPAVRPAGRRLRVRPFSGGPAAGGHRRAAGRPGRREQGPITVTSDPGLRFRVVDAITDLVEELALAGPVMIGLDDLQPVVVPDDHRDRPADRHEDRQHDADRGEVGPA
jgi:hypothetical protein